MTDWRTEQIGDCTLILGDCREVLPTLGKVDCVVADPPYGTEFVGGYNRAGDTILNDVDLSVCTEGICLATKLSGGRAVVFYSPRVQPEFFQRMQEHQLVYSGHLVWDKKAPGMGGDATLPAREHCTIWLLHCNPNL